MKNENTAEKRYKNADPFKLYDIGPNDIKNKFVLVVHDLQAAFFMSFDNKVVYITDDEDSYDWFKQHVVYKSAFGKDDAAYLIQQDWKSELKDIFDELVKDMKKKFDCCIMNPPYEKGLCMKILEQVLQFSNKTIYLGPAKYIMPQYEELYSFTNDHIVNICSAGYYKDTNKAFGIATGDLALITLHSNPDAHSVTDFNIFETQTILTKDLNLSADVINSVFKKLLMYTKTWLMDNWQKDPTDFSVRIKQGCYVDVNCNFALSSDKLETAFSKKPAGHTRFMNFKTAAEQMNFWKSLKTNFSKLCIAINGGERYVPYMNDYTKPWTDERFKKHFKLTDEEWNAIANAMENVKRNK